MTPTTAPLDAAVQAACAAGNYASAAETILAELGGDVARFIHGRFRVEQHSADVFSMFAEDLWLGLPGFAFRCSVRAWVFTLARNAGKRFAMRDLKRQRTRVPLSAVPDAVEQAAARARHTSLGSAGSERERRLEELRKDLSEEDQLLLTLRLDRELEFAEIALVTLGQPEADTDAVEREAARLRKRLQLLKERLRKRWHEHS
ncbi:MAG: hypothetical protein QM778_38325 [Myxococcales bacterium]